MDPLYEFVLHKKKPRYRLGGCKVHILRRDIQFFSSKDSRSSNFLLQIARGSGAILSECTFSLKKHITQGFFQERPLQGFSSKEPGPGLLLLVRLE
jgi:hypothetical protein